MSQRDLQRSTAAMGQYAKALVLYAQAWLDVESAQDVVQSVFVRLLSAGPQVQDVQAWLFRCVRNAAMNELRSRRNHKRHHELLAAAGPAWFDSKVDDLIDAKAAQQAMELLPAEQREVVIMRIWGQMTLAQIAAVLDEPVSTVFSRYTAALAAIRQRLESCKTQRTKDNI